VKAAFFKWIKDLRYDFRVPRSILSNFNFAMFGLGNSEYGEEYYNKAAIELFKILESLSALPQLPLFLGDHNMAKSAHGTFFL
jgi:tRNA wybutosine-synthesizing protein 1